MDPQAEIKRALAVLDDVTCPDELMEAEDLRTLPKWAFFYIRDLRDAIEEARGILEPEHAAL